MLGRFAIGVLLLLVVTSTVWYLLLGHLLGIFLWLTDYVSANWLLAEQIIEIKNSGGGWVLITTLSPLNNPVIFLPIVIGVTRYTIGLPLLWALVIATPGSKRLRNLTMGSLLLSVVIVAMIVVEILFQLLLVIGPKPVIDGAAYVLAIPFSIQQAYAIGLGHQVALIAATVLPIIIWAVLNGPFIRTVAGDDVLKRLRKQFGES